MARKQIYRWKSRVSIGLEPEVAAAELERIKQKHGELTPASVVQAAEKRNNPLHKCFEWNDEQAGHQWRLEQARYMIRSLEVEIAGGAKDKKHVVRAFASLGDGVADGKRSVFHNIEEIMADSELHAQLLRKIWNELLALRQRYDELSELRDVWVAIDKAQQAVLKSIKA